MFSRLPFTFLFFFVAVFGTLFSISSSHWLGVWVGLEINLIGFLPILLYQKTTSESESAVKYFIVQALGSGLLIFGSLFRSSISFTWEPSLSSSLWGILVILRGLTIKIGLFPFHFWLPSVMAGLPWFSCIILATWQKVAPLFLLSALISISEFYSIAAVICLIAAGSSLVGGFGGLNQTQIRAILAYSSIGHLGWIIFASCHRSWGMKIYFSIYLLISITVFSALWLLNVYGTKRIRSLILSNPSALLAVMIILLSLAGLPPLVGFISKWVVLLVGASRTLYPWLGILILGSLMSLFYYLGLYFSLFLGASKRLLLLTTPRKNIPSFVSFGVLVNALGGLSVIFLNFIKRVYALIIFDKP